MALIAYSGFEGHINTTSWMDFLSPTGTKTLFTTGGPFNDPYMRYTSTNSGAWKNTKYDGSGFSHATIICGFYFYGSLFGSALMRLHEVASGSGYHSGIGISSQGMLYAISGRSGSPVLGGIVGTHRPIKSREWHYIESKHVISDTVGSVEIRLDGNTTPVLLVENQDNFDGPNGIGVCDEVGFAISTFSQEHRYAHIYICDGSGGAPFNDFLGEVRCPYQPVDGNGTVNQWEGSDADSTDNYLHVDERPTPDQDASYVESDQGGDLDQYALDLDVDGKDILTLMTRNVAQYSGTGLLHAVKTVIRAGGTDYDGDTRTPGSAYATAGSKGRPSSRHDVNPDTATAWVDTDTAEFGQEIV